MKSIFISFLGFAIIGAALYFDVFQILASKYVFVFAVACLIGALIFAFKNLGNPFAEDHKDNRHDTH
jgi:hypothetical protein